MQKLQSMNAEDVEQPNRLFRLPLSALAQKTSIAPKHLEPWSYSEANHKLCSGKYIIDLELYSSSVFLLHLKADENKTILDRSNGSLYKVPQKSTPKNIDKLFNRHKKSVPSDNSLSKPLQKFK